MADLTALALAVLTQAQAKRLRLGTVESCTGGLIAASLTGIPGSSAAIEGGVITYSNDLKQSLVGVPAETLALHGAVSSQTAAAMVGGLLARLPTIDLGIAVTGIAGPQGGTPQKPVGLVYLACQRRGAPPRLKPCLFSGNRTEIREAAVASAFYMLLEAIEDHDV